MTATHPLKSMEPGLRAIAERMSNADTAFAEIVDSVIACGMPAARAITALYIRLRVARRDNVAGTIRVTHGAFLDVEPLRNALSQITTK